MLMHICRMQKNGADESISKAEQRNRHREWIYGYRGKRGGWDGLGYWELHIQTEASLVAQPVKNTPAMQKTWVQFLGGEDPLEKKMATHSSIGAWRIPWTEEPGKLQSMGCRVRHD